MSDLAVRMSGQAVIVGSDADPVKLSASCLIGNGGALRLRAGERPAAVRLSADGILAVGHSINRALGGQPQSLDYGVRPGDIFRLRLGITEDNALDLRGIVPRWPGDLAEAMGRVSLDEVRRLITGLTNIAEQAKASPRNLRRKAV